MPQTKAVISIAVSIVLIGFFGTQFVPQLGNKMLQNTGNPTAVQSILILLMIAFIAILGLGMAKIIDPKGFK